MTPLIDPEIRALLRLPRPEIYLARVLRSHHLRLSPRGFGPAMRPLRINGTIPELAGQLCERLGQTAPPGWRNWFIPPWNRLMISDFRRLIDHRLRSL